MTVNELIELLKKEDPEAIAVVWYRANVAPVGEIKPGKATDYEDKIRTIVGLEPKNEINVVIIQ